MVRSECRYSGLARVPVVSHSLLEAVGINENLVVTRFPKRVLCHRSSRGDRDDTELAELGALLRERNALDARIGRVLDRPVNTGSIGEWIAARIFDVELETAANAAGYDGRFTTGGLTGRTVNIKAYTKHESMLDINLRTPLDYYLVLTGAPSALASSRSTCDRSAFRPCSYSTRTDSTTSSRTAAREDRHSDECAQSTVGASGSISAIQQPTVGGHRIATSPA